MPSSNNQSNWVPPVSFYFKVVFQGTPSIPDTNFLEVTGLNVGFSYESLDTNSDNLMIIKGFKHGNLILKRAMESADNALVNWVDSCFKNGFGKKITTYNLVVSLMNENGDPVRSWSCFRAFPVKWDAGTFSATTNKLAIETLELCYSWLEPKK